MGVINPKKDEELLEEPIEEHPVLHIVEVDDCWTTGELKKAFTVKTNLKKCY